MTIANYPRLFGLPALSRTQFNALAGQQGLPFLVADTLDDPSALTPDKMEFLHPLGRDEHVRDGRFTPAFEQAYQGLVELQRRRSVGTSLAEGRTILVVSDMSAKPVEEKRMILHLMKVRDLIDRLYLKQNGAAGYVDEIEQMKEVHPQSWRLFWRNFGPWALASQTADDPFANALPDFPERKVDVWPTDVEYTPEFFKEMEGQKILRDPWTVVRRDGNGGFQTVPYHVHYQKEMGEIAAELDLAADAVEGTAGNETLTAYLRAAAQAFHTGEWDSTDKKWVAMNMQNSRYAVRVAPDETYWAPGNMKAAFEFWFAEIDPVASQTAQALKPLVQEMEDTIGSFHPHYPPRQIDMQLPDFIEMRLVGGDHRHDLGAIVGQALPNFSDEVSRMVVMTNFYTDPKSDETAKETARLLLTPDIADTYEPDQTHSTYNTLLHELTHRLGVNADTWLARNPDGSIKKDENGNPVTSKVALGGQNAQVMEELKAQTAALFWLGWLADKGVITWETARERYIRAILWAFGHIANGMLKGDDPRTYSQLSGIQIRWLMDHDVISYQNGLFKLHLDNENEVRRFYQVVGELFEEVHRIQVMGDREAASALREDIVTGQGFEVIRAAEVRTRLEKFPKAAFDLRVHLGE